MEKQNIRIKLKAFDHRLIDKSAVEIVETAKRTGGRGVRDYRPHGRYRRAAMAGGGGYVRQDQPEGGLLRPLGIRGHRAQRRQFCPDQRLRHWRDC